MSTYKVHAKEVYIRAYLVNAENKEDARRKVFSGAGDSVYGWQKLFQHFIDETTWEVEEVFC